MKRIDSIDTTGGLVMVIMALYPVSKWYGNYKSEHKENKFLRYL